MLDGAFAAPIGQLREDPRSSGLRGLSADGKLRIN